MANLRYFLFGCLFYGVLQVSFQLKDVKIVVPTAVIQGDDATLRCFFDLEGDKLYSVKWYRGVFEFYRYTPSESPPIKKFKINGLKVRESDSYDTQVVLEQVPRSISGIFSCEVTADQPSFFTVIKSADLQVVDLPRKDPLISGLKPRYRIGDILKANCTSKDSYPAANLTWYVNGQPADPQNVHPHRPTPSSQDRNHYTFYFTAHSTLRLHINEKLFEKGQLKIRCSSNMHNVYHKSAEKSVSLEKKRKYPQYYYHTTTMVPYLQRELAAERPPSPPKTTLTFQSQPINIFASTSASSNTRKCIINAFYTLFIAFVYSLR